MKSKSGFGDQFMGGRFLKLKFDFLLDVLMASL